MGKDLFRKWLSYFKPQNKFFDSEINSRLEVRWIKGRKILNTKIANYSYGGLQEVLERGLNRIPLENVNSVLVLGMGGGCVVDSLRNKFDYRGPITGVEKDPVVIQIAKNEFGIHKDRQVELIEAEAKKYIIHSDRKFDLVIIDLFIDVKVPSRFYSKKFWKYIENSVNKNGFVLFNAGVDLCEEKLDEFLERVPSSFVYQIKSEVLGTNTVIIFQKFY
ncbi:MAG TPA: fused MFS/spermidine synthase [Flavobacteriaceae bacterium]|nr:fused MFS/spermidine synthase [Flavobacteriaceae bacterium]